ncbi:hypothetical protein BGZ83_004489 [Gryganskiella cystojenkinii]|nr:hypothetical protein BGZ83_004489 [Gryganskiella cystojenkinii]
MPRTTVDGTCHQTSLQACPIALGCDPWHSFSYKTTTTKEDKVDTKKVAKQKKNKGVSTNDDKNLPSMTNVTLPGESACFPLPVCQSLKDKFKKNTPDKHGRHQPLIRKIDFLGDPDQAHWTSDFDHLASGHAEIDSKKRRLLLKAKRDKIKTQSGGGFGATISSTRWNKYGTFSAKFKSGATGPGIVTAMMLSNPILGEEVTFQVTGRDPKKVITDFYRDAMMPSSSSSSSSTSSSSSQSGGKNHGLFRALSLDSFFQSDMSRGRKQLKDMLTPRFIASKKTKSVVPVDDSHKEVSNTDQPVPVVPTERGDDDGSLEETHALKKSATENDLVYKIEWTEQKIEWSVDNKVIRTLRAKDLIAQHGIGLPSEPMQLQFTIWDAGHSDETRDWAGGVATDYGVKNEKEYVTSIEWIEIVCQDPKASQGTAWPGPEAQKRLAQVNKASEVRAKEEEQKKADEETKKKEEEKKKASKKETGSRKEVKMTKMSKNKRGWVTRFVDALLSLLLRWAVLLVTLTMSAEYLTRRLKDLPPCTIKKEEIYGLQQ